MPVQGDFCREREIFRIFQGAEEMTHFTYELKTYVKLPWVMQVLIHLLQLNYTNLFWDYHQGHIRIEQELRLFSVGIKLSFFK